MARKYGRLHINRWSDDDYQALDPYHQGVYDGLISYPDVTWCGVIDYMPKRLVKMSDQLTIDLLDKALRHLADRYFLVIDDETEEILIRTFIRWDGVMHQKNVGKAMFTALKKVKSKMIKYVIVTELIRLKRTEADLKGWEGLEELAPNLYESICDYASDPSWRPFGDTDEQ